MSNAFLQSIEYRRSVYTLDKHIGITSEEVINTITQALQLAPAAFNAQTTRIAILLNAQHDRLWEIVYETLQKVVPTEQFARTEKKLAAFKQAYGTILYFEDQETIKTLQQQAPTYADTFPEWSLENQGIVVFCIWSALATKQIGASIQHYNPLIDDEVRKEWHFPESWRLLGQMPFGHISEHPPIKQPIDMAKLIKVFK